MIWNIIKTVVTTTATTLNNIDIDKVSGYADKLEVRAMAVAAKANAKVRTELSKLMK